MKRMLIAIMALALTSCEVMPAMAQVNMQIGASMLKPADGQVGIAPALSIAPELGSPIALGLTFTAPEDTTYEAVLYVEYAARTWEFSAGKSFELKLYVGTDIRQGSELQHKRFAFTGIYDHGKVAGVDTYGRLVHNRVNEGVNWGFELGLAVEMDRVLGQ